MTEIRITRGLGVSCLLHFALAMGLTQALLPNSPPLSLQVRSVSPQEVSKKLKHALEKQESQIVSGDDQLAQNLTSAPRSQRVYLSKRNQQVDHETRAARVGAFRNVLKEGISPLFKLPTRSEPISNSKRTTGLLRTQAQRSPASEAPSQNVSEGGLSATDDFLKDVAIGANTLLNTQEFRYYGFYERIREKLSHAWNQELNRAFEQLLVHQQRPNSAEQTTRVEIELNAHGQLTRSRILVTSGINELDHAALRAFQQAAPFPNPPEDLLENTNSVLIKWDFVVVSNESDGLRVQIHQSQ